MNRPVVYLAGPITGLSYEDSITWRDEAIVKFELSNIKAYSPMRHKESLKNTDTMLGVLGDFRANKLLTDNGILLRDSFDVGRCDLLFVNLKGATEISVGTVAEIAWAWWERKPIVVVMEKGNVHEHAFINSMTPVHYDNIEDALQAAIEILT